MCSECHANEKEIHRLRAFVRDVATWKVNLHGSDARQALVDIKDSAAFALKRKEPCGECHLRIGETCDICGVRRAT